MRNVQIQLRSIFTILCIVITGVTAESAELSSLKAAGNTGIRMVAQDIRAVIDSESAEISAMCHIIGNGIDTEISLTFSYSDIGERQSLAIYTDKGDVEFEIQSDDTASGSTVFFTLPCPAKDEFLGIGLNMSFTLPRGKYGVEDTRFSWDLSPSNSFHDKVEDSRLTIYLKSAEHGQLSLAKPEPVSRDMNRIMWQFGTSEPSEKIEIALMQDDVYHTLATTEEIIESGAENAHAYFLNGAALFARSLSDNPSARTMAIERLEKALEIESKHTGALWFLAVAYHLDGQSDACIKTLETLISFEPAYHCEHRLFPKALMDELPEETPKTWLEAVK